MALLDYALTTVSRFASYAGLTITSGSTDETLAENLINQVTSFIEDYLGYRVQQTDYTQEEYDTEAGTTLNLNHFPVASGETFRLQRRTNVLDQDDWETVTSEYYHVDYDAGIILAAGGWEFIWTRRGYRVTYTAGYDFDNSSTYLSDTEGGGIELAAWMLLEAIWNKRKGGGGVIREKIGDYSITYKKTMMENEDIKNLLDKYARNDVLGVLTPLQI